jgi:hypothetical protein
MEALPLQDAPPLQSKRRLWPKLLFALVCLLLAVGTFAAMRYRAGAVPDFAYAELTAPDGSCKLLMIGAWHGISGERFASSHWSTPIATELRWESITPGKEDMIRPEDLFATQIAERAKMLEAKIEKEAAVKWNEYQGREAVFVNGRTRWVERYLFVTKPGRPRLYMIGVGGSGFQANSEAVPKVFGSFRLK